MTDSGLDGAVRVLEVSKYHLEMITFRFERLPGGRKAERTTQHCLEQRSPAPFIDMAPAAKKQAGVRWPPTNTSLQSQHAIPSELTIIVNS